MEGGAEGVDAGYQPRQPGGVAECRFGWEYENSCTVGLSDVLSAAGLGGQTLFYEPFLQTGPNELYPVPVKIINKDEFDENIDPSTGQPLQGTCTSSCWQSVHTTAHANEQRAQRVGQLLQRYWPRQALSTWAACHAWLSLCTRRRCDLI